MTTVRTVVAATIMIKHFCFMKLCWILVQLSFTVLQQVRLHQQKAWSQHSAIALSNAFNLLLSATLHHHPIITTNLYHLPLEGSVTSFWPAGSPELSTTCTHHRLSATAELRKLEEGGEVGVVVDVTCPELKEREEVECQTRLLDVLLHVCSVSRSAYILLSVCRCVCCDCVYLHLSGIRNALLSEEVNYTCRSLVC